MGKYLDILNLDNRTGWPKQFVRYSAGAVILAETEKKLEQAQSSLNTWHGRFMRITGNVFINLKKSCG